MDNRNIKIIRIIVGNAVQYHPDFMKKGPSLSSFITDHVPVEHGLYFVPLINLNMEWILTPMELYLEENS